MVHDTPVSEANSDRATYRRWIVAVLVAETAGFGIAAVGAITAGASAASYGLLVAFGALEGACLGAGQAYALRGSGILVPQARWIGATAAGAAIAWSIGLLPSTLQNVDWERPAVIATALVLGVALLGSIPLLQAAVLARLALPVASWVGVNALAWLAGISWTLLPSPFIDERTPAGVLVVVYVWAGALMALTVAAITGIWVVRVARLSSRPHGAERPWSGRDSAARARSENVRAPAGSTEAQDTVVMRPSPPSG
jgi:hypothetical protein